MTQSINALWHRAMGPSGFYDFRQQIVILPNIYPRPSVIMDHEITHVSVVNCSTIGLLQQVGECLWNIGLILDNPQILETADRLSGVLLAHSRDVHEAAAWFGTELNSVGLESISAPDVYRDGVKTFLRTVLALVDDVGLHEQISFTNIMQIVDAVASYALSPPVLSHYFQILPGLDPETLDRELYRSSNNTLKRFKNICSDISKSNWQNARIWADWVMTLGENKGDIPKLTEYSSSWLRPFHKSGPVPVSLRPSWDSKKIPTILSKCCQSILNFEEAKSAWLNYVALNIFNPKIDRYSQCCLVERPFKASTIIVPEEHARDRFFDKVWLTVSLTQIGAYESKQPIPHKNEVFIFDGQTNSDRRYCMKMTDENARHLLTEYAMEGGSIVLTSLHYDLRRGDFIERNIVSGLDHAVMAITDVKSIWLRMAFLSDIGIRGTKNIEYVILPSKEFPDDFGFLLLKPKEKPSPIIVVPLLMQNWERAMSVTNTMVSPFGVTLERYHGPIGPWISKCGSAISGAITAFDLSLEQPDEILKALKALPHMSGVGMTTSQKLSHMSARHGLT